MKYRIQRKRKSLITIGAHIITLLTLTCDQKAEITLMEKLTPDNFLGWTAKDAVEQYNRETIFDYIDGAGEVYLLYDFQSVLVKRYANPDDQDIIVEIFDMGSSYDAYGIFSHSHEKNDSLVGQGSDFRGSLMCFWKNRYYICISAEKEESKTNEAILELARAIDSNIGEDGEIPALVGFLPDDGLRANSIKYFHKYTSLNYHYYLSEKNILHLDDNTEAVLAIYDPGRAYLLIARYENDADARAAHASFIGGYIPDAGETGLAQIDNKSWVYAVTDKNFIVAVFDSPDPAHARGLVDRAMEKIIELQ